LDFAGREVLIKAVAQSVPTYSMSCFQLSKTTCKRLTSIIARYWWGGDGDRRKMHWRKWSEIAHMKQGGGMGFRDLQLFNLAMLGKQGWRLLSRPESLCARTLKGKYFHDASFMSARKKRNSSHTWQAILKGREVLEKGLIRLIGDGRSTNVWTDQWIPGIPGFKPLYRKPEAKVEKVHELLTPDGIAWNDHILQENFLQADANAIRTIPLGRLQEDLWAWSAEKNGIYSVKSAYRLMSLSIRMTNQNKTNIASSSIARKIQFGKSFGVKKFLPK
jgi:hypothetical protein